MDLNNFSNSIKEGILCYITGSKNLPKTALGITLQLPYSYTNTYACVCNYNAERYCHVTRMDNSNIVMYHSSGTSTASNRSYYVIIIGS